MGGVWKLAFSVSSLERVKRHCSTWRVIDSKEGSGKEDTLVTASLI